MISNKIADAPSIHVHFSCKGVKCTLPLQEGFWATLEKLGPQEEKESLEWLLCYQKKEPRPLFPWMSSFLERGSSFDQIVWSALANIPFGETHSYSQLAKIIGKSTLARAVGGACGRNPLLLFLPCHRVIRSEGSLGGFSSDLEIKKRLLSFEKSS